MIQFCIETFIFLKNYIFDKFALEYTNLNFVDVAMEDYDSNISSSNVFPKADGFPNPNLNEVPIVFAYKNGKKLKEPLNIRAMNDMTCCNDGQAAALENYIKSVGG